MIQIGQKIKEVIEEMRIEKKGLSAKLNMSATNLQKIFKRDTIDTGLLVKLSVELEHNFFAYYDADLPKRADTEAVKYAEQQAKENEDLRKELKYLKEINSFLREKVEAKEDK